MAQTNANVYTKAMRQCTTIKHPRDSVIRFNEWRYHVNSKPGITTHPFEEIIRAWNIDENMLQVNNLGKDRKLVFVDTEEQLLNSTIEIAQNKEITVHAEIVPSTYYPLVSLIQISTWENDYSIDCVKLFDKIKLLLRKIFENPEILKVFHEDFNVKILQANFDLFVVGGINIQEPFSLISDKQANNLDGMIQLLLKTERVESAMSKADWLSRPISQDLVVQASQKSKHLFECWIKIKENFLFIEHEPFPMSKLICLEINRNNTTGENAWLTYISSA